MNLWTWIVLGMSLVVGGAMGRAFYFELLTEAALRWYQVHDEFVEAKPWYVRACERRWRARRG